MTTDRPFATAWLGVLVGVLAAAAPARADDDRERRFPAVADVEIDVALISGRIEIEGWDRAEVRIRVRGDVEALDIEVHDEDGEPVEWVAVRAPGRRGWLPLGGGADADVRIDVPRAADVHARILNGPIRAKDLDGRLSLHAANGEIDVAGAPAEADLETVNGSIDFRGRDSRVHARSVSGAIDLRGVADEVSATTMSSAIRVAGRALERVELRSMSGAIDFAGSLTDDARADLKSYSGSITLELPSDTSARFGVQSFSGGLRSELGDLDEPGRGRRGAPPGAGRRIEFDAGAGDARVSIDTFSGSVRIESRARRDRHDRDDD